MFYRLPYWQASIKVNGRGGPKLEYVSNRLHGPKPAELRCSCGPASDSSTHGGSIEHFLPSVIASMRSVATVLPW